MAVAETMMAELARKLWTLDEFLAFDDGTDRRYELVRGEIVAMAPPSLVHGALTARLAVRISAGLRPPCDAFVEVGIILPERNDTWYQADLAVGCSGITRESWLADPVLIVEILSPSTSATDLARKLPDYRTLPSLRDILVVSSLEPRIEHFAREADGWKVQDHRGEGMVRIPTLGVEIDLAALYHRLLPVAEAG
jgi:Uma2 family endonuclease